MLLVSITEGILLPILPTIIAVKQFINMLMMGKGFSPFVILLADLRISSLKFE